MEESYSNTKEVYKYKYLTYTLTEIDKGVAVKFVKGTQTYEVIITQKSAGYTSMTDYYGFGDLLTYNEFKELEDVVNRVEDLVMKYIF